MMFPLAFIVCNKGVTEIVDISRWGPLALASRDWMDAPWWVEDTTQKMKAALEQTFRLNQPYYSGNTPTDKVPEDFKAPVVGTVSALSTAKFWQC